MARKSKRREWTASDVRTLKTLTKLQKKENAGGEHRPDSEVNRRREICLGRDDRRDQSDAFFESSGPDSSSLRADMIFGNDSSFPASIRPVPCSSATSTFNRRMTVEAHCRAAALV